jgi:hypothetical protein
MFYELMWRAHTAADVKPLPWWVQEYFRRWVDSFDAGLIESKETAFQEIAQLLPHVEPARVKI